MVKTKWMLVVCAVSVLVAPTVAVAQISDPIELEPAFQGESEPLTDLADIYARAPESFARAGNREMHNPRLNLRKMKLNKPRPRGLARTPVDTSARQSVDGTNGTTPEPILSFEGTDDQDNGDFFGFRVVPPDTEGDVGHKYYVQSNNLVFEIFDKKDGDSVLGPLPNNIFFAGTGTFCDIYNDGDPIVMYDHKSRRWIFSQFAVLDDDLNSRQCFAVSKTSDPRGAYYLYEYVTAFPEFGGIAALNDYPKLSVWSDGIYYSANDFEWVGFWSFRNVSVAAFDKEAMYDGDSATGVQFKIGPVGATDEIFYSLLPSDWEGDIKPKKGTPNTFWQMWDSEEFTFSGASGPDGVLHWDFYADFDDPEDSEFVARGLIELEEFESFVCPDLNCIDQPDPGDRASGDGLDGLDYRLMHRAQYRNFGKEAAVVVSATVDPDGIQSFNEAGVLWAELRSTKGRAWKKRQSGVFAPDDGEQRFMPSIAQNKKGEIAIGYTVSSVNTYPAVRYTTRREDDELGVMTGGEMSCHEGTGSQVSSANRWGDYSAMVVDPQSDCTFWYTNEYYESTGAFDFKTRICSFNTCAENE